MEAQIAPSRSSVGKGRNSAIRDLPAAIITLKVVTMRRARRSGRLDVILPKRGGNGRLRANRRDTASIGGEGLHKPSCVGVRRESHRRRMTSFRQRSGRGCMLLGTAVVAAMSISGTGETGCRWNGTSNALFAEKEKLVLEHSEL